MRRERELIPSFYKKLLGLYPRAFKDRFEESMLQTFNDQCDERWPGGVRSPAFLLWTFAETAASVVVQHFRAMKDKMAMKNLIAGLALPAIVGTILVLPFVMLEYVNTQGFKTLGFPVPLFGVMWLLPFVFVLLLMPTVRDIRSGAAIAARPVSLVLRAALMIVIAMFWIGLVNDQMPCFLGVPNCD